MHCSACEFQNPATSTFCGSCGRQLALNAAPTQDNPSRSKSGWPKGLFIVSLLACLLILIVLAHSFGGPASAPNAPISNSTLGATPPNTPVNLWSESEETSAMDGKTTIVLSRTSDDTYQAWLGSRKPRIAVQCYTHRHPDVFVEIGGSATVEYGDELHTVRIKFDGGQPTKQRWSQSKDNQALFASSPTLLIGDMKRHKLMLFEFDPFNTPTSATVSFEMAGLAESMSKHSECAAK